MIPSSAAFTATRPSRHSVGWRAALPLMGVVVQACSGAHAMTPEAATARAQALLQPGRPAAQQAQASPRDTFVLRQSGPLQADQVGQFHIRFDRAHQGVPVLGGDIIVHLRPDGSLVNVTSSLPAPLNLPTVVPRVPQGEALSQALAAFRKKGRETSSQALLMVAAWTHIAPTPTLAWRVEVIGTYCKNPSRMHYWFDAQSGALLNQHDEQESAVPMTCKQ
jgi:Zn-dependent metalloprotease